MGKEVKRWFKVSELSKLIGLSRVSVYKRLKQINIETLQSLQKVDKGIQYYDIKILDLLQSQEQAATSQEEPHEENDQKQGNYIDDYIKSLQEQEKFFQYF